MPIVSNTSPVLNLAIIDLLDLLQHQFGEVILPPAVIEELQLESDYPGVDQIHQAIQATWLKPGKLTHDQVARALRLDLDNGEAEAIALSLELGSDLVLMDEHDGRSIAKSMGLTPVGVLGVLLRAKRTGDIGSIKKIMQRLQKEAGFYIAGDLFTSILQAANES